MTWQGAHRGCTRATAKGERVLVSVMVPWLSQLSPSLAEDQRAAPVDMGGAERSPDLELHQHLTDAVRCNGFCFVQFVIQRQVTRTELETR